MSYNLYSSSVNKALVQAAVLGATSAATTAVDLGDTTGVSRDALVTVSITVGSDVPTTILLQHSSDNSTFATHTTIANADLAATGIDVYSLRNVKRYLRITWIRAASAGDTYWSVCVTGYNKTRV